MWPPAVGQIPELDFVFIDTEHQAIDRSKLSWMCRACDAMGLAPVVRIPAADAMQAAIAMDAGARGLIAPRRAAGGANLIVHSANLIAFRRSMRADLGDR
jgi:2-keto-3-deoxy-L-rhamnonate aldolase RhmA